MNLPKSGSIAELPTWAAWAFAWRCTNRVFPLFMRAAAAEEIIENQWSGPFDLVSVAEHFPWDDVERLGPVARSTELAFEAGKRARAAHVPNDESGENAAACYEAACRAIRTFDSDDTAYEPAAVLRWVAADFERTVQAILTTPLQVGAVDFGPMWPAGCPAGWPTKYVDPKRDWPTGLPCHEDISRLPTWAILSLATRCAERIAPISDMGPYYATRVLAGPRHAVEHAKQSSKSTTIDGNTREPANRALNLVSLAAAFHGGGQLKIFRSRDEVALESIANAHDAAVSVAPAAGPAFTRDFECLATRARKENWGDATPVTMSLFGPLWPEGRPEGWPAEKHAAEE